MRIGIDARMYGAAATSGIGVYIQQLIDQLVRNHPEHEYVLFLRKDFFENVSQKYVDYKNVKTVLADIPWYGWQEQIQWPRLLQKQRLDLLHVPHFNIPLLYRGKMIVTIHDVTPHFFPGPRVKKSWLRRQAYNLVVRQALKRARSIITISEHTRDNIIKIFGTQHNKIQVVYPGVDQKFLNYTSTQEKVSAVQKKYNVPERYILYVGVWRDHKNLPGLITAFNLLQQKYSSNIGLVLAGKPDVQYPEIPQAIESSPYKNKIYTPGFIADEDLADLYAGATVFVLPSFCEGFGLVAVEAAACGAPVVASATTSVPEILHDGALYFDPYNPQELCAIIFSLINNQDLRRTVRDKSQGIIARYQWAQCADEIAVIYDTAMRS